MLQRPLLILNFLSLAILVLAGLIYFRFFRITTEVVHVHKHAGFHLYVDGVKQDLSGFEHMSFTPCGTDHSKELTPEELQLEKTHLHDGVGEVAHVHHQGATWGDLLKNIDFEYDENKEIVGYSEAGKITDILSRPIEDKESVIIVIGDQSQADEYIKTRPTLEAIEKVETASELCGSEG